ncbi:MAG TPA: cation:proton antiporter, partial [Opitutales bacterium]|nr:cation:proton antiporter [Opitutales bacterium]
MQDTLIHDLTIVIVCAAVVSFVFSRFNLSVILGYLLCGLLIGPNMFQESFILNESSIEDLSELGVIFLMFYIGLEFDLTKLRSLLGSALPAVLLQTVGMVFLGVLTTPIFGWSPVNGLFLGSILAISSSMVTFAVMREQGATKHSHGQLAIGILILEDIVAIMLLVVLSGVALTGHFAWEDVGEATFLVAVFVMMVFSLGKLLTPGLLRTLEKMDSMEVILLVTMGLVLGVGFLAEQFKFSIALGAFLAGAILAHSSLSEQIEKLTEPFRYLFSAIFFVTVGMLIEPEVLMQQWGTILVVACLVIVGKVFTCWLGLSMSGQGFRNSFKASMAKAQIGEFSFVIAALGQSLGVTDPRLDSITIGTALVTILLTPLLSKHSDGLFDFFAGRMPSAGRQFGQFYLGLLQTVKEHLGKSDLLKLIRRPALQILGYFLVFNGILFLSGLLAHKVTIILAESNYVRAMSAGVWVAGGLCCLPFLVAVIRNLDAILM